MWIVSWLRLTSQLTEYSPRRTIATAQTLYMRFHLFFPYADFQFVVSFLRV